MIGFYRLSGGAARAVAQSARHAVGPLNAMRDLQLKAVRLCLDGRVLLAIDATVRAGEVLTIMGPSGWGKSSLLAFVAGLLPSAVTTSGTVWLAGQDITGMPAERSGARKRTRPKYSH